MRAQLAHFPLVLPSLLSVLTTLSACGGSAPPAATPSAPPLAVPPQADKPVVPPAPALPDDPAGLAALTPPDGVCKLAAATIDVPLELAATGDAAPFARVTTGAAKVSLGQGGVAFAEVTTPAFAARGFVSRRTPVLHPRKWVSFGGVAFAAAHDRLIVREARAGKLVVEAPSSLISLLAEPYQTTEVACDDVSIAEDESGTLGHDAPAAFQPQGSERTMLAKAHAPMVFSADPNGPAVATFAGRDEAFEITMLEQRGGRARVRRGHVAGWIDARLLTSPKPVKKKTAADFGMIGLLGTSGGALGNGLGAGSAKPAADATSLACSADVRLVADVASSSGVARYVVASIPAGAPVPIQERGTELAQLAAMDDSGLVTMGGRLGVPSRDLVACKEGTAAPPRAAAPTADLWSKPDAIDRLDPSGGVGLIEAKGNMWGDAIGDSFGAGGLGLSGSGIGLGRIGGTSHASPAPAGSGPTLTQGATMVAGRLPPEVIQRIVRQNFGRFRLCYENALRTKPTLQGRITIKFHIDPSGAVDNAEDGGSDLPDGGVVSCVVRGVSSLSFPQPEGGSVTVTYPITFSPGAKPSKK